MAFVSTTHCGTFCVTRDVVGRGILDAQPVGADIIRPPHGGTGLRRPHFLSKESGGKERAGRGISISPALHPPLKTTNQGGAAAPPYWMYPPSCPTGNVPAAAPYFVTGPPLGAGDHRSPLRGARRPRRAVSKPHQLPWYFSGMAPAAARRAKPVQRNNHQGLRGNPDACHPGRGSACNVISRRAGGNASPVLADQTQPTAAMSPRFGGCRGHTPALSFPPLSFGKKAVPRPSRRRRGRFR